MKLCSVFFLLLGMFPAVQAGEGKPRFTVSFSAEQSARPLDGRLLLLISNDDSREPRFQIQEYGLNSQLVFGMDVEGLKPGQKAVFDGSAFGYPLTSLHQIPDGEYQVQALLHRYETFNRADGATLKLPMNRGAGQSWNRAPGNLLSTPQTVRFSASGPDGFHIELDRVIPPIPKPKDTKYIKHIKIRNERLSKFWGRDIHLGAVLLLPEGYDEHPQARYPLVINHGHFPYTFRGFSEKPPEAGLNDRAHSRAVAAHAFYQRWTGPDFPRVIVMLIQHANPYYDDSYAVNTANLGPYGDAITYDLVPYVEKTFRGMGQSWARTLYGGSTGGWESVAATIYYPDEYNGCWAACPDSLDFRAYQTVNLYEDSNAYFSKSHWKKTARPGVRNHLGHVKATLQEMSYCELALGSKGRSGQQLDIFQAVYGPLGQDGYPKPIWDKLTGEIDKDVAAYWKENYDLSYILRRDAATLTEKLAGKIRIYMGDMDTFYLNNATYLLDDYFKTEGSDYRAQVYFGDREVHCWSGDQIDPKTGRRMGYHSFFIPKMVDHMLKTAPKGADTTSWRY